ncbi:MAG TPA: Clp protease N-terminal domain-containing protein, partial [Gemmatimonadota bacterium]|nr:Clp protease N-terminal domain-containing protein [Gemmatimonadota bacterium]
MQLDRLTNRLQEALVAAQQAARRNGNPEIQPEHLAQALLAQDGGLFPTLLTRLGVDVDSTRRRVDDAVARLAKTTGGADPGAGREL